MRQKLLLAISSFLLLTGALAAQDLTESPLRPRFGARAADFTTLKDRQTRAMIAKIEARIESDEHYFTYRDVLGFELRLPATFITERSAWSDKDGNRFVTLVAAARGSRPSEQGGWLDCGLRLSFQLPPEGRVWKQSFLTERPERSFDTLKKSYTRLVLEDGGHSQLGGMPVKRLTVVGENPGKIAAPEMATVYVLARPEKLLTVEVAAPAGDLELGLELHQAALTLSWTAQVQ